MSRRLFDGTEVKYLVQIESVGFDMATDNFEITLKKGSVTKHFDKSDLIQETTTEGGVERTNFYLCFDTTEFGPGVITAIIKAYVPDASFPDRFRTEVDRFNLTTVFAV